MSGREALTAASAPFLLAGGTADPFWGCAFAREVSPHVLEIPDADHGLFVPRPLALSAADGPSTGSETVCGG